MSERPSSRSGDRSMIRSRVRRNALGAAIALCLAASCAVVGAAAGANDIAPKAVSDSDEPIGGIDAGSPPATTATHVNAMSAPTRHVLIDGHRIAYRRFGQGQPLLMATRFRGTLDTWDPLFLDELGRTREVVLFDYPGIGHSKGDQPDDFAEVTAFIESLRQALALDSFALLGWSWGGLAAQAYTLEHPQRVTRLVLLATNPPGELEVPLQPTFLERALKPVTDRADEDVLFFEPRSPRSLELAGESHARIHARPDVAGRIPSTPEQFQRYFDAAGAFHADAENRRSRLAQLDTPILVISGDHDTSTAGQNWFPLIGRLRNAQFVYYSETGHAPHHQYPRRTAALIVRFLGENAD